MTTADLRSSAAVIELNQNNAYTLTLTFPNSYSMSGAWTAWLAANPQDTPDVALTITPSVVGHVVTLSITAAQSLAIAATQVRLYVAQAGQVLIRPRVRSSDTEGTPTTSGITISVNSSLNVTMTVVGGGAVAVQDEGVQVVATASAVNFVGAGVTATDGGSGVATVTIPDGGAGKLVAANNLSDVANAATARTNLGLGSAATQALDTDGTLAANSDTRVASQKATKTYVDQIIAAQDAMVFKGVIDCSSNPNYPAADRGWTYRVSVAGKIGGASGVNVEAGDLLLCLTDGTSSGTQAAVGANWSIAQANIDGAVVGPASAVSGQLASFSGTSGKLLQDSGIDPTTLAPKASPTFTGITTAPEFSASGLTGATQASRYVGATASGAPASGTFAVGDYVVDQTGIVWVCTVAGTPGTWVDASSSGKELVYAENVTNTITSVSNSAADVPGCSITVPVSTKPVWINFVSHFQTTAATVGGLLLNLVETTVTPTTIASSVDTNWGNNQYFSINEWFRLGAVASSRTFKLQVQAVTGAFKALNGPTLPTFITAVAR